MAMMANLHGANSKVTVSFLSIVLIWAYSEAYPDFDHRALQYASIYTDHGDLKLQARKHRSSEVVQGEKIK